VAGPPARLRNIRAPAGVLVDMNTKKIHELVESGRLLTSPMRARSSRDIPVIRAALRSAA
jgi:hypothetical protein